MSMRTFSCMYVKRVCQVFLSVEHTKSQDNWNTKVGDKVDQMWSEILDLGVKNNAGEQLIEFCKASNLFITNGGFRNQEYSSIELILVSDVA